MQIRAEQIDTFDAAAEVAFRKQVAADLRDRHGDAVVRLPNSQCTVSELSAGTLAQLVDAAMARGRACRLAWRSSLNAFAALMVTVAPGFDRQPAIRRALEDARVRRPPDVRMRELGQHVTDRDWFEAVAAYRPADWGIGRG